jgi:hypothetical protein
LLFLIKFANLPSAFEKAGDEELGNLTKRALSVRQKLAIDFGGNLWVANNVAIRCRLSRRKASTRLSFFGPGAFTAVEPTPPPVSYRWASTDVEYAYLNGFSLAARIVSSRRQTGT